MNAREKHLQDEEEHLQKVIAPYERDESEAQRRGSGERPPTPWYARKSAPRPRINPFRRAG